MTKNQETAVPSIPEYCYDRDSEKKNQQIIRRTQASSSGRNHKNVRVPALPLFTNLPFREFTTIGHFWITGKPGISAYFALFHYFSLYCRVLYDRTAQPKRLINFFDHRPTERRRRNSFGRFFCHSLKTLVCACVAHMYASVRTGTHSQFRVALTTTLRSGIES